MLVFKASLKLVGLMDLSDQGNEALYLHPKGHYIWAKVFLSKLFSPVCKQQDDFLLNIHSIMVDRKKEHSALS